jgi:hypothetical protein
LRCRSRDRDSLVSELRDQFERATKGFDIPTECGDLAVLEIGTSFESRDVGLIDLRLLCHVDLSLARSVAQGPQGKVNALRRAKTAPKHSNRLDL